MCRIYCAQLICRGFSRRIVAIEYADPGACLLEAFRNRSPYTLSASGDDGSLPGKTAFRQLSRALSHQAPLALCIGLDS
jgi:hypothetical protein